MARLEDLFDPKMFKESFLGTWSLLEHQAQDKVDDSHAEFKEFFQTKNLYDEENKHQARMALRIVDYESVGAEKQKQKIKSVHPDHVQTVLPDPSDPSGPKL